MDRDLLVLHTVITDSQQGVDKSERKIGRFVKKLVVQNFYLKEVFKIEENNNKQTKLPEKLFNYVIRRKFG